MNKTKILRAVLLFLGHTMNFFNIRFHLLKIYCIFTRMGRKQ